METTTTTTRPTDLIRMDLALKALGDIKPSTFWVACKRHDYLKQAIVTEIHEETGKKWTRISRAAVERYAAERRAGGSSGSHPGEFKVTTWLKEEEFEKAAELLTKAFKRPITIDRLYRAKANETNGTTDEADEDEETDDEA
jgi:hypothetical protein